MNRVLLIGRLTDNPNIRAAKDGSTIALLRLAVPRRVGGDEAVFVSVTCFGPLASAVADHLVKGRRVAVEGRLDQREWTDANGNRRERHGVVAERIDFLDPPPTSRTSAAA